MSPQLSLNYGLLFNRLGGKSDPVVGANGRVSWIYDYLTLPLALRWQPWGKDLFVTAGGRLSHLLESRRYRTGNKDNISYQKEAVKWQTEASAGVGYRVNRHLEAQFQYHHGLTLIQQTTVTRTNPLTGVPFQAGKTEQYLRSWALSLSYFF